nr:hypothetical protein [Tanacetum cinerariifolium]
EEPRRVRLNVTFKLVVLDKYLGGNTSKWWILMQSGDSDTNVESHKDGSKGEPSAQEPSTMLEFADFVAVDKRQSRLPSLFIHPPLKDTDKGPRRSLKDTDGVSAFDGDMYTPNDFHIDAFSFDEIGLTDSKHDLIKVWVSGIRLFLKAKRFAWLDGRRSSTAPHQHHLTTTAAIHHPIHDTTNATATSIPPSAPPHRHSLRVPLIASSPSSYLFAPPISRRNHRISGGFASRYRRRGGLCVVDWPPPPR